MNVPIFISKERAGLVAFSSPVWALRDGLLVRRNAEHQSSTYEALVQRSDARLGVVAGAAQVSAAKSASIGASQLVEFRSQPDAVAALLAGDIDASQPRLLAVERSVRITPTCSP
ncbi:transporter substrate-binding domain-containing protein [Mitsuaria sp. BK037]|jgi:polar amino acid transport system substrate-binding protein|uniref:transporter substrate-binding domain-containing protein n=1 Tax=Mitsuaria sp. BK037 TaxID=2587122 RepID=UPI00161325D5|nr:ABC-type amino acid transport substrate-binding protein [Mitsuaria sp. BK037]